MIGNKAKTDLTRCCKSHNIVVGQNCSQVLAKTTLPNTMAFPTKYIEPITKPKALTYKLSILREETGLFSLARKEPSRSKQGLFKLHWDPDKRHCLTGKHHRELSVEWNPASLSKIHSNSTFLVIIHQNQRGGLYHLYFPLEKVNRVNDPLAYLAISQIKDV